MFNNVTEETKERTVNNIAKANSKLYKSTVAAYSIVDSVLDTLTDEEIKLLASLPKEKLTVKVGFSLWDIFKK